jgi:hypothetical protein
MEVEILSMREYATIKKTADYWILFFALAAGALYLPGAAGKSSPRIGAAVCQDAKIRLRTSVQGFSPACVMGVVAESSKARTHSERSLATKPSLDSLKG